MSLKYESGGDASSDDESFRSSRSIIFSSGKSSSPALSRSSSMSSGISAKSATSSESTKKSKAMLLGPISRPSPTELLKTSVAERATESDGRRVQQQNCSKSSPSAVQMNMVQQSSQKSSPIAVQMKRKKKNKESFVPIQPKIVRPIVGNMQQPQGWVTITTTTYSSPMYGPPVSYFPHPMMHYAPPPLQMPMGQLMPVPYSAPMPPPSMASPMYNHMQVQCVTLQAQYTYTTFTYIDRS